MNLGDFSKETLQYTTNRYLRQITPQLDAKTYIEQADELYKIAILELNESKFRIDNEDLKRIYHNALLYFRGDERSEWDLKKGIFAVGGTGSGKTIFFDIFKKYTTKLNSNSFVKIKQLKIISDVAKNGMDAIEKYIKEGKPVVLYIDDFGSGNSTINYYGTNYDVLDELIQARYDEYIHSGALTHLTTNVMPTEFKDIFNERIVSRFSQMFNVVLFPAKDYRRH